MAIGILIGCLLNFNRIQEENIKESSGLYYKENVEIYYIHYVLFVTFMIIIFLFF